MSRVDQVSGYIFVVDNFLIAPPTFEIYAFEDKLDDRVRGRDAERLERLASLRLHLDMFIIVKSALRY